MSDPVDNDYSSVSTLTPEQERRAVLSALGLMKAKQVGSGEAWDLIDMLGLRSTAVELLAKRGKTAPAQGLLPNSRDNLGRVRTPPARCKKGLHDLAETGKRRVDNGTIFCTKCAAETQKRNRHARAAERRAKAGLPPKPEFVPDRDLGPGERWCNCQGERHVLTPVSSETTYVRPGGERRCRAARRRQEQKRMDVS